MPKDVETPVIFYWIAAAEIVIEWVLGITIFIAAIAGEDAFYSIGGVDGTFFTVVALVGLNALIWVFMYLSYLFGWPGRKMSKQTSTETSGVWFGLFGTTDYLRYHAKAFFAHVLGLILQAILYNEVADTSVRPDPADTQNFVHYMVAAIYQVGVVAILTACFLALHQAYWNNEGWMFSQRRMRKATSQTMSLTGASAGRRSSTLFH